MPIKNFGTGTPRLNEGIVVSGSSSTTALRVYQDASNVYAATIDNDQQSGGHGMKITSDGTGTGTYLLDIEAGSTTLFRFRGDGRLGIGTTTPGQTLTVEGDIGVGTNIVHKGDSNTYIGFDDDEIDIQVGGRQMIKLSETGTDKIIINNGEVDVDLQVKSANSANVLRTDAANDSVYFGSNEGSGNDNNFWVSGSISSKGTATRGTAVFGGDLVISGGLHATGEGIIVSGAFGSTYALYASGTVEAENLFLDDLNPVIQFREGGDDRAEIQINDSDNLLITNQSINKYIVFKTNDAGTIREGFRLGGVTPEVVVNEGSDSLIDFRVESNSNTHMLFVDGGNNNVGINDNTPTSTLSINGSLALSVLSINAGNDPGTSYTIASTDCVILVNTRSTAEGGIDSAITLTLPDASDNPGMVITVKDSAGFANVNNIVIQRAGSDTIEGVSTTLTLNNIAQKTTLISDGNSVWAEIGS